MAPKFGTIPRRPTPPPPVANPFDMINIMVGAHNTTARPFEMTTNSETGVQYPSRASTSCPSCGHGIIIDIRQDQLMSGQTIRGACDNCKTGQDVPALPLEDPFRNPLAEGLITRGELDPLYVDPATIKVTQRVSAAARVSERRKKPPAGAPEAQDGAGSAVTPVAPPEAAEAPSDAKKMATAGTGTGTGCGVETTDGVLVGVLSDNSGDNLPDPDVPGGVVDSALDMGEEPDGD